MVIAALFNGEKHINYANPPDKNPFNAYYVDAAIGKKPEKEVKPATLKGFIRDKKGNLTRGCKSIYQKCRLQKKHQHQYKRIL